MRTFLKLFLTGILSVLLFSCKSKKVIIKISGDYEKKISFIPSSEKLKFDLSEKENMPFPDYDFGAEIYKGKIYAFLDTEEYSGNWDTSNFGSVCVYDIKKNKWEIINKLPKPQWKATSVIIKDKIYLIGSYTKNHRNQVQVYNISTNSWEESFQIPIGLYWTTIESYKNKIYVIGGYCPQLHPKTDFLNTVQIFDTKEKKWTSGKSSPLPMHSPNSLNYHNEFYVWDSYYDVFFKYNPIENKWNNLDKLKPFVKGSQEGIKFKDKFLFISGNNNSSRDTKAIRKIFTYDLKTNEYIESLNDLSIGRHYNYGVFEYKNKIYILGGREEINWKPINKVVELNIK